MPPTCRQVQRSLFSKEQKFSGLAQRIIARWIIKLFLGSAKNFITIALFRLTMQYQILKEPMAILDVQLNAGETITAESGAMVYIKGDVEIKTRTREGGLFKKLKVTALGGESFFVNDYVARGNASIGLT